ncbi:chromosome partitioning protein ParA [Methylobacterium sp. J-067]|uniref:chromosome partitioning protein ParA n=1 Tax=Methylobacterium sp. J-067 TaxID=2836648 RepID=UPI001FBA49EB|nr:chromosome partitioning protein ParA [Methylobacterium sp. J-067]MCJ2023656.1 chromosome partitioning protein ParA [Methylobacterium sp. J-067]
MAIDYRSELRRPLPFSLAIIAAVLLLWLVVASIAGARQRGARDHRVGELEGQRTALQTDLDQQRSTAGTLAALQARIATSETEVKQATQAGEEAKAKAAGLIEERQAAERKAGEAKAASDAETKRLSDLQTQVTEAERKLAPLRDATTAAEKAATARTQELADVGRRVEDARQQEARLRADIAAMAQEATGKTAELAKAEERQQKAREGAAVAQKELADARTATEQAIKQRADLEQAVAGLTANREKLAAGNEQMTQQATQARETLDGTQKDLATAQAERDRVTAERGQAEKSVLKLTSDRDAAAAALEALQKQQADAQGQLATLTETMSARNKEVADVEEKLRSARAELADAQAKLADARQQLSTPPAPAATPVKPD